MHSKEPSEKSIIEYMVNRFREFYKQRIFKESADMRLTQIDFGINELIAEMQNAIDPTKWRHILDAKEILEAERELIITSLNRQ